MVGTNLAVIPKKVLYLTTLLIPPCSLNSRLHKCVTLVVRTKGILLLCSTKYEITWTRKVLIHFFTIITT